jgi:hypothetical protein
MTAQGRIIERGWRSNIVVDRCRMLLASFMKGDAADGIRALKVGMGLSQWDTQPEPPVHTAEQLADPSPVSIAIGPSQMVYLDAAGAAVAGPTPRLEITVTLGPGVPPLLGGETSYPLREFGLFGLIGSEEYMIDYVRHPVIHKQAGDTIERKIRLIL